MGVEVTEHVKHGLEPQVLYVALPVAVQRQAQVLWAQVGMVSGGVLDWPPAGQVPFGVGGRTMSHRGHMGLCQSGGLSHLSPILGELLLWGGIREEGNTVRLG